ncbi:MAG: 3-oxoadipate enol-lactonase [Acidimicrobiaceae bacterium]|nr:3-oxoadipate enol-lactonase [Acidimicrobiaceae bacterium]
MQTRKLDTGEVQLELAEAGAGSPRHLMFLHGFGGAKEDFTEWLDRFAGAGWHAVAFDQRGHGASAKPRGEEHYSLRILEEDVAAVVDQLGWDRFVLFGHSMGGMIAQLYAIKWPERLRGLILMGTSHKRPDGIDAELVSLGREVVRAGGTAALIEAQKDFGPGPLETQAHRLLLSRRPDYGEFCDRKTLAASEDMWVALSAEMLSQPDRLAQLEDLSGVPTLVIVGAFDETFLQQCGELAGAIPDADLAVIGLAGHCPQFERPEDWWDVISKFLADL